jgi:hypothetical protein
MKLHSASAFAELNVPGALLTDISFQTADIPHLRSLKLF